MKTTRLKVRHVISFRAAVDSYRNGHLSPKTNKVDRNLPITTKQGDLSNSLKHGTCIAKGPQHETKF